MLLTELASYAEVRAVLGVSATEVNDTVLAQPQWGVLTTLALEDVNVGIPALYTTVSALLSGVRTSQQQRFYDLVRLFASYSCAKTLLSSLPLFSVKSLTDGRAEFERQADIFEDVRDGVDATYNALRQRLTLSYVALSPSDAAYATQSFAYTASTGLGINPVTNA